MLAGGFGSRLKSVVSDVPKPLAPIGDVPFLHYQIENWIAQGVRSFVFLLHHQADLVEGFLERSKSDLLSRCLVRSVTEPTPLDTGGAVAYAVRQLNLDGEFLVANADTWLGGGIRQLGEAGADALLVVSQPDVGRYGQVEFDPGNRVTGFREKGDSRGSGWINAGMCLLKAAHFREWQGERLSLEQAVFPRLLSDRSLKAVPVRTDFLDIGVPEDYERFCRWQTGGREERLCN